MSLKEQKDSPPDEGTLEVSDASAEPAVESYRQLCSHYTRGCSFVVRSTAILLQIDSIKIHHLIHCLSSLRVVGRCIHADCVIMRRRLPTRLTGIK